MLDFVVNPAGASGRTNRLWQKLEPMIKQKEVDYRVHFSTKEFGIDSICRSLTENNEECNIIILGGDGTVNEAINGIMNFDTTRIGIIPCGSGNDLARDLQFEKDLNKLLDKIIEQKVKRVIDVGQTTNMETNETRYFLVSSGMGFDAEICYRVDHASTKKWLNRLHLGKLSYLFESAGTMMANKHFKCQVIDADGDKTYFDHCLFAATMNHRFEGGGFMFGPLAKGDDGELDLCLAHHFNMESYIKVLPKCYSGNHVQYTDKISMYQRPYYELITDTPVYVHTDGEVHYQSKHVIIQVANVRLQLLQ